MASSGGYSIADLEQTYTLLLKQKIQNEKAALDATPNDQTLVEKNNLSSAQALASDAAFRRELQSLNLDEQFTPEVVEKLFDKTTQINKNLYATILSIKDMRVNWPEVINELDRVTKKVDPLYGTTIQSNIDYSNLSVNAADRTISIRGETRTDDTRNFTLLSDLIDELEKSPLFSGVFNRTFSKADQQDQNFTSSFNLSFALQTGDDSRDVKTETMAEQILFPSLPTLYAFPVDSPSTPEVSGSSTDANPSSDQPMFPEFSDEPSEDEPVVEPAVEAESEATSEPAVEDEPAAFSPVSADLMQVPMPFSNFFTDLFHASDAFVRDANPRVPRQPRNH